MSTGTVIPLYTCTGCFSVLATLKVSWHQAICNLSLNNIYVLWLSLQNANDNKQLSKYNITRCGKHQCQRPCCWHFDGLIDLIYNYDITNKIEWVCILGNEKLFRESRNFDTSNFEKRGVYSVEKH